jgi:hypothetical protein
MLAPSATTSSGGSNRGGGVGRGASGGSSIFPEGQNPAQSATTSSGSKRGGGGVRELESGVRVGNILAENANSNAQLLNVAVDENIGNQANNNDHGDVSDVMEGVLDTAAVENMIDYQNNNNDTHGVVDAPVGDVPPDDIGAVENINNESINNDNHDVVDAPPVGNVTDWLLSNVDNHHMANVDPQEPGVQVPPDIPVDGRQHLLPRRLPTRPALTKTQQGDDYVLLREIACPTTCP